MDSIKSPRTLGRIGGLLYLIIIAIGFWEEMFVRGRIVAGDAATTAANLRSMESLWRLSIAGEFILLSCAIPLAVIWFVLLRPVNRELALVATLFNLVTIAVEAAAALNLIAALFPLGNAQYLGAFQPEQLNAFARMSIRAHGQGFSAALIFFGWTCVLLGYLIFKSTYLPKFIGVLMVLAGASYLIHSFALIVAPPFASTLYPPIFLPPLIGESAFALWLLIRGVNEEKWRARTQEVLS